MCMWAWRWALEAAAQQQQWTATATASVCVGGDQAGSAPAALALCGVHRSALGYHLALPCVRHRLHDEIDSTRRVPIRCAKPRFNSELRPDDGITKLTRLMQGVVCRDDGWRSLESMLGRAVQLEL